MFRRDFIQGIAGTGAATASGARKTVRYRVKGFSCVTCAVGLEVMLREKEGVASAKATYPAGEVTIGFDPAVVSEEALKSFIRETGFMIEPKA